jgi:spore coat polysaccharide biosynthesis protein SpsF
MRVVAIVQARMGSHRLPGKVLKPIAGRAMIARVLERVLAADRVDAVVVATTTLPEDDRLVASLGSLPNCAVYRGDADDVLARYFGCASEFDADIVVRVTADDPLKDPEIIDRAVSILVADEQLDYCSNTLEPSFPEGLDIEVFRFPALSRAHAEATLPSEREHVTPYIWNRPDRFVISNFRNDRDLKDWRWTVDKQEDLDFMSAVFGHFQDRPLVSFRDVIAWLDENPHLVHSNAKTARNEGYLKSTAEEGLRKT